MPDDQGLSGIANTVNLSVDNDLENSVFEIVGGEFFSVLSVIGRRRRFSVADDTKHKQECRGTEAACGNDTLDSRARRIDDEAPAACDFAGDKSELAFADSQSGRIGRLFARVNEFVE